MPSLEKEPQASAIRDHLRQLFESSAFKGSKRSQQFLQYIVDRALARNTEELKERNLGVVLFGRDPAYDTGDDAVVRVTASDVRKRLQQFYSEHETPIRIELLAGSYTPEFRIMPLPAPLQPPRQSRHWLALGLLALAAVAASFVWLERSTPLPAHKTFPWSALLQERRQLQLVLADPDISAIQELTGSEISLTDYANQKYLDKPASFGPDLQRAFRMFRGVNVAAVDVNIVAAVSRLAAASSSPLKINTARSMQLGAFRTDDDFIILGSFRSNPWGRLFEERLDFDFIRDPATNRELIRNKKIRPGELPMYVPTAGGWDSGEAFAIVALVANPNQAGQVLLIAGTNAESTEAAGKFITTPAELSRLRNAGRPIASSFEVLLRVRTMAGSSRTLDVVALHNLSPN